MKITEKQLLDNLDGISKGGDYMSKINGETVWWTYRTGLESDGFNCICDRDRATEITLENNRHATIEMVDCDNHPALKELKRLDNIIGGDEIG